ncbi:MAG: UDP-N-acetylmuramate--L-alanine ligase, partial [bacterium]|nr:UDP-N-acetylmuramate--L-alanine ligase [bacterium]
TERAWAVANNVRCISNFELLGEISKDFSTIVVTGTNGKSTTTAMLGVILEAAGYDPTVLVGTLVPGFKQGNLRIGKGRFFVVEGCEYKANMLNLEPEMIVLTNIEEDHLDFYRDLDHIKETFQTFVDKLQGKGLTIWNNDDENARTLSYPKGVSTGIETEGEYHGHDRSASAGQQAMQVNRKEGTRVELGELALQVPGAFNLSNALQATAAAMEIGVPFETCARALAEFTGVWRRFERLGQWNGAELISDYGHHPTGIKETIEGAKEFFPGKRIVLCYQPHQHDRTRKLFDRFVETLPLADELIVTEIYDVAGRNEKHSISSRQLVTTINGNGKNAQFAPDFATAKQQLTDLVKDGDVLIIMGAGDIDQLARELV